MIQVATDVSETSRDHPETEVVAKMDPAIKAKWVVALRSGEIEQGTGYLEIGGAMCCLGVLAKVQGEDVAGWPSDRKRTSRLPDELAAGLSDEAMTDLAHRNDGTAGFQKNSFPAIADYIEANL